jgi:hypothetical protein
MSVQSLNDLILLVADKNMEMTFQGLLSRRTEFGIGEITYDIFVHPQRDPGVWIDAENFLRPFLKLYKFAIVAFDYEGSGQESTKQSDLKTKLTTRLSKNGWDQRSQAIIFQPELEVWVWSEAKQVDTCLGWRGQKPSLKQALVAEKYLTEGQTKPADPKAALEWALQKVKKPRSSALYLQLAQQVPLSRCNDAEFLSLRTTLSQWFAPPA